jgi:hypothetical protein
MKEEGTPLFGLELECAVPENKIGRTGGYHDGIPFGAGKWFVERDASLDTDVDGYRTVEMVSPVFSLETLDSTFNLVRDRLGGTDDDGEGIRLNSSCGAHIHFSWKPKGFQRVNGMCLQMPKRTMEWIRNTTFSKIGKKLPHAVSYFKKQYFRGYARKIDTNRLENLLDDRHYEFHFTSKTGIEWRSFNLLGASNWGDIKKMVRIGCETLRDGMEEQFFDEDFVILTNKDFDISKELEKESELIKIIERI